MTYLIGSHATSSKTPVGSSTLKTLIAETYAINMSSVVAPWWSSLVSSVDFNDSARADFS